MLEARGRFVGGAAGQALASDVDHRPRGAANRDDAAGAGTSGSATLCATVGADGSPKALSVLAATLDMSRSGVRGAALEGGLR